MEKPDSRRTKALGGAQGEVDNAPEESMEDWFSLEGSGDIQEGEVVRGRVVELRESEILVDIGYKSEGTIPIEEFRHAGSLPKVGDEIEVYLESKEDNEGLIVLSKDKADKIKVWDQISGGHDEIELALLALRERRVDDELAVDEPDAHRGDGLLNRHLRERQRRAGAGQREHVRIVLGVR